MKIVYISPSLIPSNTANSIHVINQVKAFESINYNIILLAARTTYRADILKKKLFKRYGVNIKKLKTIYIPFSRINELIIAFYSMLICTFVKDKCIISRNLYASLILSLFFDGKHIYEIHELFPGYKMYFQKIKVTLFIE